MLNRAGIKSIREQLQTARRNINLIRGTSIIHRRLQGLIEIEGWGVSTSTNSVHIRKNWDYKPVGETSMDYFLNMVGIVNKALDMKMSIDTNGYGGKPSLSASVCIHVNPIIAHHLPKITIPPIVIRGKVLSVRKTIVRPKESQRVHVFVDFGQSDDCEFEVEVVTETVTNKRTKLVGDCAQAIANM